MNKVGIWHHPTATAANPELFGVAKHFCTKNGDRELSYKYTHSIQVIRNLD
jgi:hypothetical protein